MALRQEGYDEGFRTAKEIYTSNLAEIVKNVKKRFDENETTSNDYKVPQYSAELAGARAYEDKYFLDLIDYHFGKIKTNESRKPVYKSKMNESSDQPDLRTIQNTGADVYNKLTIDGQRKVDDVVKKLQSAVETLNNIMYGSDEELDTKSYKYLNDRCGEICTILDKLPW